MIKQCLILFISNIKFWIQRIGARAYTNSLEMKIQIQLDLHLQRSMKVGTSPNVNSRCSIALLKRLTKSKLPNLNQTYQLFIYYQTNET